NQEEAAQSLGVSLSSYQKYEREKNSVTPSLEVIVKLADFYGVTTDYLLGRGELPNPLANLDVKISNVNDDKFIEIYEQLPEYVKQIFIDTMIKLSQAGSEAEQSDNLISIKFFEKTAVSAGTGLYDDNNEYPTVKQVPKNAITSEADFCCYVNGKSMLPLYDDGDLVFVKAQQSVEQGEIGIFALNGEMYIKQLGSDELISLNPEYDNIKKSPDIICQGKVLGKL
ncbi:MAG: helix-turn-helix domain-containing protein, partial [Clostridia bacterium]|nr:helix-turn-helix domain-containing protein [Clostridia bacterium]